VNKQTVEKNGAVAALLPNVYPLLSSSLLPHRSHGTGVTVQSGHYKRPDFRGKLYSLQPRSHRARSRPPV